MLNWWKTYTCWHTRGSKKCPHGPALPGTAVKFFAWKREPILEGESEGYYGR